MKKPTCVGCGGPAHHTCAHCGQAFCGAFGCLIKSMQRIGRYGILLTVHYPIPMTELPSGLMMPGSDKVH